MTRTEFCENVSTWEELLNFCYYYDCDICEDIYDEYNRDLEIDNSLRDMASTADGWQSLLNILREIPTGYDFYERDEDGDWTGLDEDDFDILFSEVLDWADEHEVWDNDEEEPLSDDECDEDDFIIAEEPISIGELMSICSSQFHQIGEDKRTNDAADDEAFEVFVTGCVTIVEGE